MTNKQKIIIAKELIDVLSLRRNRFGLYITQWGSKSPLGIYQTVRKIMKYGGEKMSLYDGIAEILEFQGLDVNEITDVTTNVGGCWFKCGDKEYSVLISECESSDEKK